jgi:hypothetical protein
VIADVYCKDQYSVENKPLKYLLAFTLLLFCGCSADRTVKTGLPSTSPLYREIQKMDSALSEAFNAHDVSRLMILFSRDLEFYHDTGGLQSYDYVANGFKRLFASNNGIERSLVPGSLEVFPIKDYGAVEIGVHRFCHVENGEIECGDVQFVHIWKFEDEKWRITRVISYDH